MKKKTLLIMLCLVMLLANVTSFAAPSPSPTAKTSQKNSQTVTQTEKPKSSKKTDEDEVETETKKATFPVPRAKSAIIIDANSGDVIYALNGDKKVYPAGLSNIMTAVLVLESCALSDTVIIGEDALTNITYDQPQLGIKAGESYTVEQLLLSILLNSNNDAANALAIHVSGTIDTFVARMNEKAAEIGLSGTHFSNPTGRHDPNHYTTAQDMAYLSQFAMKNSTFAQLVKTPKYVYPATALRNNEKTILSTNHLVSRYKYPYHYYANATGIKSGNSTDAGYCLSASAVKGKLNIISVVMGCENKDAKDGAYSFIDTAKIFDYVFENYQSVLLAKKGDVIYDSKVKESKNSTRLALTVEEDIYVSLKKTSDPELITSKVNVTEKIKAPIAQGDIFGTVTFSYNDRELKTVNAVAANEVKRDFILFIINKILGFIFHPVVLILIVLIFIIWARIRINQNRKRRIRHKRMVYYNGRSSSKTHTNTTRQGGSSYTSGSSYRRRR